MFSDKIKEILILKFFFSRGEYFPPQTPNSAFFLPPTGGGRMARINTSEETTKENQE
jgi:hypothetical protein